MALKPGDFFLGVVDFLAVLVPGIALLLLDGKRLLDLFMQETPFGAFGLWLPFIVAAYVLGQFLFAAGELVLDPIYYWRHKKLDFPRSYHYKKLSELEVDLLQDREHKPDSKGEVDSKHEPKKKERKMLFHRAFSRLRLKGGDVLAEVERSAASFKLFRSLVLVFALDVVVFLLPREDANFEWANLMQPRVVMSAALALGAYLRFDYLKNWTEDLVFEFALLISSERGNNAS